jgi:hypothetical protein
LSGAFARCRSSEILCWTSEYSDVNSIDCRFLRSAQNIYGKGAAVQSRGVAAGSRTAPERQHTVRATLDWSYELLLDAEQRLLDCLSVFASGWTFAAAEGVCARDGIAAAAVLDPLTHLVDRSHVMPSRTRAGVSATGSWKPCDCMAASG